MSVIGALLPILIAAASPNTSPNNRPAAEPTDICLTSIISWGGSIEDTRRIAVEPVPRSYRDLYAWTGCQQLAKGSLLDWHLAFGDEASTTKALQFLADTALVGMPSPENFAETLPAAWQAARRRRAPDAARVLSEAHDRFLFLADEYLRAADFFRSPVLLAAGERYFSATMRGLDVFYGGARIELSEQDFPKSDGATLFSRNINFMRDLEMRHAILQARMSGSPADWKRAGAVVAANFDTAARDIETVAFDGTDDYCQSEKASSALKKACDTETDLPGRLHALWRNAELVEQFSEGKVAPVPVNRPYDGFDMTMAVISITTTPIAPESVRYDKASDDRVQLRLARAESRYRLSSALPPNGTNAQILRVAALTDLDLAERLVPAALNPNRFRQVASLYLRIYEAMPAAERRGMGQHARQAGYLRAMLLRLGDITNGV